jgi:hypothetical protein
MTKEHVIRFLERMIVEGTGGDYSKQEMQEKIDLLKKEMKGEK